MCRPPFSRRALPQSFRYVNSSRRLQGHPIPKWWACLPGPSEAAKPCPDSPCRDSSRPGDLHHPLRPPILPLTSHPPLPDHLKGCPLRHPRSHSLCHRFCHLYDRCHHLHPLLTWPRIAGGGTPSVGMVSNLHLRHHSGPHTDDTPLLGSHVRKRCGRVTMEGLDPRPHSS